MGLNKPNTTLAKLNQVRIEQNQTQENHTMRSSIDSYQQPNSSFYARSRQINTRRSSQSPSLSGAQRNLTTKSVQNRDKLQILADLKQTAQERIKSRQQTGFVAGGNKQISPRNSPSKRY